MRSKESANGPRIVRGGDVGQDVRGSPRDAAPMAADVSDSEPSEKPILRSLFLGGRRTVGFLVFEEDGDFRQNANRKLRECQCRSC